MSGRIRPSRSYSSDLRDENAAPHSPVAAACRSPPRHHLRHVKHTVREKVKADGTIKRRVRSVAGGNKIRYPADTSARTAELETFKLLLQAAVSERAAGTGGKFATLDIKDFYIQAPLDRPEYVSIPVARIPRAVMDKYNLWQYVHNDRVLFEVLTCMYGLPQAGILSQDRLFAHLAKRGYHQDKFVPCLFKHEQRSVMFVVTVDDFAVKYTDRSNVEHLLDALRELYEVEVNWQARKYLGYTITFDDPRKSVSLSMPD